MTTRKLTVVTAGLSRPSSTRMLADRLSEAASAHLRDHDLVPEIEVIEVRDHAHDLADHLLTGFPSAELRKAIDTATGADGLIVVTPIFTASYSGLFKSFFDVLEPDSLAGKPVLIGATGGTARHSLVLEHAVRPLFAYLRSVVVPTAVYAASEDWGTGRAPGGSLSDRADRAAGELADLLVRATPVAATDPYENPTPFDQLLAGGPLAGVA